MNLREVIEKSKVTSTSCGDDYGLTMVVSVDQANEAIKKALAMQLDAIIKRVNQEASEYVNDEQAGRTALAYELHNELSRAREDITSLQ